MRDAFDRPKPTDRPEDLPHPDGGVPLSTGDPNTVGGLIEVLQTFPPEWPVYLNRDQKIATVDGRGNQLWLCDLEHTPHVWIQALMAAKERK